MFFKFNENKKKLLQVDNDFAVLESITSINDESNAANPRSKISAGNLQFVFSYKLSQLKAIEESATSVRITVKTQSNASRPVIIKSKRSGDVDNVNVIERILTHKSRISQIYKSEEILCLRHSDITAKINNQLLGSLKSEQADLGSLGLVKQKLVLKTVGEIVENNLEKSVIYPRLARRDLDAEKGIFSNITSDAADERELYHRMLHYGQSPSLVENTNNRFTSTYELSKGIIQSSKKEDHSSVDVSNMLLNFFLFDNRSPRKDIKDRNSEEKLTVLENVVDSNILLKTKIELKATVLELESPIVAKFELLQIKKNSSGETVTTVIEDIEKPFNPNEYIKEYFMPMKPPAVRFSRNKNVIQFSITQKDKRANKVNVYKKTINNNVYSDYALIDSINILKYSGPVSIRYAAGGEEFCIYRFVPVTTINKDYFTCQFTDVVIHQKKKYKHLVLIPQLTDGGIRVHAYNKDPMIKSARLLVRDIRTRKSIFSETGKTFNFSKTITKRSEFLSGFQANNIYEFTTKIQLKSGIEVDSSHVAMIEFLPNDAKSLNVQFTNISNPGSNSSDVQMSVSATVQTDQIGQIDQLRNLVSKNYTGDESRQAIFDKYIFFNIFRYDTLTGEEVDLGIIVNGENFIDSVQASKLNAPPVLQDRSYKYVIQPLIRNPDSFEESVEKQDETTRKKYKLSPKKHNHPIALKKGTLFSKHLIDNDPKHAALYGKLGVNYFIDLENEITLPVVSNFVARKNSNKILLSWEVQGILSKIDHFIILKEIDGIRQVIGKSHAIVDYLNYRQELTYPDIGSTKYILTPVYSDYSIGAPVYSNEIIVEESDIKK